MAFQRDVLIFVLAAVTSLATAAPSPTVSDAVSLTGPFKRDNNSPADNNQTDTGSIVAYAVGGTAAVLAFVVIGYTWFRKRAKDRNNNRMRAQDHPAVRANNMGIYAREQERKLRASNARKVPMGRAGSSSTGLLGVTSPDSVGTPPPSYFDGAAGTRLPRYPSERTLRR